MGSALGTASKRTSRSQFMESISLRAHEKWRAGELRAAFRLMRSAAKLGAYAAKHNLGYFYDVGIGVKRDRDRAMYWYREAFKENNAYAASNIGTIYRDEMKTSLALRWFHKAVALGDADANLEIAKLYLSQLNDPQAALGHLKLVLKAKRGVDVTTHSQEHAAALMKKITATKRLK